MKQLRCLLLLLPLILITGLLSAQKKVITGKVIDAKTGEPLGGASVLLEKSKSGISTKADGTFTIALTTEKNTLVFSFIGYTTQIVVIGDKTNIDIALQPVVATEAEVVVIGYGTQKRTSVTGAVSKYQNEKLDQSPVSRLDQALQGKIAGVQIQNIASEAGSDPKVQVRGISSINAGQSPLVVVDGQPVPDGLSFVNMSDVLSIEVLKDAASAAIYGSRGASGVILITTKSGKAEKASYNLKISSGYKSAYSLYPIITTTDYTNMLYKEAALRYADSAAYTQGFTSAQLSTFSKNKGNLITTAEKGAYILENQFFGGSSVDWQRAAIRTANVKTADLSVSGGSKDVKYYIAGSFQDDPGNMIHSEYKRYNLRSKINVNLSDKVKLTFNLNPSYIYREKPATTFTDFTRIASYLPTTIDAKTAAFVNMLPTNNYSAGDFGQPRMFNDLAYNGTMPDGSTFINALGTPLALSSSANTSPYAQLQLEKITTNDYRLQTSADLTYQITKSLSFKTQLSAYVKSSVGLDFTKTNAKAIGNPNSGVYTNSLYVDLLNENTFTFNKQINNHSINVIAGFTANKIKSDYQQITASNFISDNITTINTAGVISQDNTQTYSTTVPVGLLSYLGRVNYGFKDKYLLSASFRADGSSKFAPDRKWGYFPSVSAGWVVTKEKFLQDVKWISSLKLRASYGAVGNNNITDFLYLDKLYAANYPTGSGTGTTTQGFVPSASILSNPYITWETTYSFNTGLDVSLFKNKLTLGIDVYQSKTDKLLLQQEAMGITGVSQVINNIGKLQNNGIELEISSSNIRNKNFSWITTGNISHTQNKLLQLGNETQLLNTGERQDVYMNKVGGPLIQYYNYKTDGLWNSTADILAAQAKGLTSALPSYFSQGALKFKDVNGDNVIDANDRTVLGNPYPDFTWGIINNFTFKGFDIGITFQGVQGGKLLNGDAYYNEARKINTNYNSNRWISPNNPGDGKTPYYTNGYSSAWTQSDYIIQDASYYALREVLVGYSIPTSIINRFKLGSLRLYMSGQNLFFHAASNYKGLNIEARSNTLQYASPLIDGYQRGAFPLNRTIIFGLDIKF
jgi:TonB-linked SusC/RagA family outer membrane protein